MMKAGILEPVTTGWAPLVVFVPKKDGFLRFGVDHLWLTSVAISYSYPIPRMDQCVGSMREAQSFSTNDANSNYRQVEMDENTVDKKTFVACFGLFRYTRMTFSLENAQASFQKARDGISRSVMWQYALVYIDEIISFSKSG